MTRLGPARLTALIAYVPNAPTSGLMWPRPCCISMRATPPGRCHRHPLPTATLVGATSSGYGLPFPRMCNGQLFDNRSLRRVLPDAGAAGHGLAAVGVGVLDYDIDAVHGPPLVGEALRFISATHHRDIDRDKRANGNESPRGIDIAGEGRLSPRPGDRGSSGADVLVLDVLAIERAVNPAVPLAPGGPLEQAVCDHLSEELARRHADREWLVGRGTVITGFDQYAHLSAVDSLVRANPELRITIGMDYLIRPDVTVGLGHAVTASGLPPLHAAISCKWTIRSDRVQNIRH
jgi:hypothetical protein